MKGCKKETKLIGWYIELNGCIWQKVWCDDAGERYESFCKKIRTGYENLFDFVKKYTKYYWV